ncbi:MAG: hypothetical protein HPY45_17040 [Anaerolineae bacterium]|nr:hypothetical protein [Anaerolineae bacterium]
MERTVPKTASEEIELFLRTVFSLLRATSEVDIRTLEEVHAGMNSLLHQGARSQSPDTSAFIYTLLRLPECMPQTRSVILGQSSKVFAERGYDVESWQEVSARARRRRCFFDPSSGVLACFIGSRTDIEDLIPTLTAYQIEWNKLNLLLQRLPPALKLEDAVADGAAFSALANALLMETDDLARLRTIWGSAFAANLYTIQKQKCDLRVRLLSGSLAEYWRSTRAWWENIERICPDLLERPVYFISSNTHSILNLATGFALQYKQTLVEFLEEKENAALLAEWQSIQNCHSACGEENFFYYLLKKYQQSPHGQRLIAEQKAYEQRCGIMRIPSEHYLDVEAQVIEVSRLPFENLDPRLQTENMTLLRRSDALILNIDYPLGLAAYNVLTKVAEHADPILGVYIMGKAATLNGVIGDVMIPNVVHDEHSQNTYLFQNAFSAADVAPYLVYGTVLDNQKAVSVLGTFLQNARIMDVIYREGYTDIEMEAGPYLSAVYEMYRPKRHPVNEIVNLYGLPFDLGIVHYASDTPLSKGKNLGAGTLSYFGMDSTYAASLAILRRILQKEIERAGQSTPTRYTVK